MEFLKQPKPMQATGDLASNWKKFKENYNIYMMASGCNLKDKQIQAAVLQHCL